MRQVHRDARRFARHFEHELGRMPVAVFVLGPLDNDPEHLAGPEKQFRTLLHKLPFESFATALFGGAVDPSKLSWPFSHMAACDARDWVGIRRWAVEVAEVFLSARVAA